MTLPPFRLALLAAGAALLLPNAGAQSCSQNVDDTVIDPNSGITCPNFPSDFQVFRRFSSETDCASPDGIIVNTVFWAYTEAEAGDSAGSQPIVIRVHSIPTGADLLFANLTLQSEEFIDAADGLNVRVVTQLSSPAFIFPGQDTVLEIAKLPALGSFDLFVVSGNSLGETSDSFAAAEACGVPEITPIPVLLPGSTSHILLSMQHTPLLGGKFCGPNIANSTGLPAEIAGIGSTVAADNDLGLFVENLPSFSNGFFLVSADQFTVPNPAGSQGNICIASFELGRYSNFILNPGSGSTVFLDLDLSDIPFQPNGPIAAVAGQTLNWQYWYRDVLPLDQGGTVVSNFSDALSVTFI